MKIVRDVTEDRTGMTGEDWDCVIVFEGPGRESLKELLVKADDVVAVGKAALSIMPAKAKYAIVGRRAGRHLGGPVDAMVLPDGTVGLCRGEPFETSLFWSYEDDEGTGRLEFATGTREDRKAA